MIYNNDDQNKIKLVKLLQKNSMVSTTMINNKIKIGKISFKIT